MIFRVLLLTIGILCLLLFTTRAVAENTQVLTGLTVKEIVSLKQVRSANLSPSGTEVAYLLSVPRTLYQSNDGPAWTELHIVDLNGKLIASHSGNVNARSAAWSADGSAVFFIDNNPETGRAGVYSISSDNGKAVSIFEPETGIQSIYPSPDGETLAYLSGPAQSADSALLSSQGFNAFIYEESATHTHVWMLDLKTAESRIQLIPGSVSDIAWSSGGNRYAVAVAETSLEDDWELARDIWVVNSKTSEIEHKLEVTGKLGGFKWSPDSNKIAYIGGLDPLDTNPGRLFVVSIDDHAKRELLPDYMGQVEDFFWKNSDEIAYSGSRGVWSEFAHISLSSHHASDSDLQNGPILRSVDGRPNLQGSVAVADTPLHPAEVYLLTTGNQPQRLTYSNPVLEKRSLAKQEPVRFKARDGLELEAIVIHPLQQNKTTASPLIIFAHGGPESHYSNGWMSTYDEPAQALAAQGFTLAFPNYRGSTGRGVNFSKLSQGDSAGKEFDDLVDTKAYLVESGLVSSNQTGIAGISYGGYAAMWAATALSEHFAAAVAFVGVSNQISMMTTTDIPREMYQVHSRAWPWDNWQEMLERSPIFYANRSNTPLLILGGDSDTRFDPSQSLEMYRHIKLRTDTPVRLVIYPGEGHGNRRTAARFDYALRLKRWMTYYLTGHATSPNTKLPPYELRHPQTTE